MSPSLKSLTDSDLIARARGGEKRAFEELLRRYEQTVWGFSYKVCRDREKAAEALQNTFLNVYRHLDRFEGRSKFSTWLYTIVANNCRMANRVRKSERDMESLDDPPEGSGDGHLPIWRETPHDALETKELRDHLDAAIAKLPVDYRLVFVLRDLEEKTAPETAKILKLSIPAVKSRLRRARIFLREELREFMEATA